MFESEKKQILIVEDDLDTQSIYMDLFKDKKDKYDIKIVKNGVKGLMELQKNKIDLVLLDIVMENISGDLFVSCLGKDEGIKMVPIIVVTVLNSDNEDVKFILKEEQTDYLQKPIKEKDLFAKIEKMLG